MGSQALGPLLIALGALFWSTDALFRAPAVRRLDPTLIVCIEHLICTLLLFPWMFFRKREELTSLRGPQWLAALVIGAGGSALATIFFTASFRHINPSVAILLQKLQPILVVFLAILFLKERPQKNFYGWALVAIASGIVLSFPDLRFGFLRGGVDPQSLGVIYSLLAAGMWAISTIAGKVLLNEIAPTVVTFWRYVFGLGTLVTLMILAGTDIPILTLLEPSVHRPLLYMSLGPGLAALLLYYAGLTRTSASVATVVELIFPLGAVILNAIFLNSPLSAVQILAGVILIFSVSKVTQA